MVLLLGISSAVAVEPEEPVGEGVAVPYGYDPGGEYITYSEELDVVRGYVKKLPSDCHYVVGLSNASTGNARIYEIWYGTDLTYVDPSGGYESWQWYLSFDEPLSYGFIRFDLGDSFYGPRSGFFDTSRSWSVSPSTITYDPDGLGWRVNGSSVQKGLMYPLIYSDVGPFPDLIENREEVDYSHAQTVILASFLLFGLFRSLWRSIRGRMD